MNREKTKSTMELQTFSSRCDDNRLEKTVELPCERKVHATPNEACLRRLMDHGRATIPRQARVIRFHER